MAPEVNVPIELCVLSDTGTDPPAEDDATLPPTDTPPSTPMMVRASEPDMVPCHANTVTAMMMMTAVTI